MRDRRNSCQRRMKNKCAGTAVPAQLALLEFDDTQRLQQEQRQQHRSYELDHDHIQLFSAEFAAAQCDLIGDHLRLHDPADEDTGRNGNHGHQHIVADVVQNIQDLCVLAGGGIGQDGFKIRCRLSVFGFQKEERI